MNDDVIIRMTLLFAVTSSKMSSNNKGTIKSLNNEKKTIFRNFSKNLLSAIKFTISDDVISDLVTSQPQTI